jgi:hypothetical protein
MDAELTNNRLPTCAGDLPARAEDLSGLLPLHFTLTKPEHMFYNQFRHGKAGTSGAPFPVP